MTGYIISVLAAVLLMCVMIWIIAVAVHAFMSWRIK
jgi:hypothetical protein